MVKLRNSLGSDSINPGKVVGVTLGGLLLLYFAFVMANATPGIAATGTFYAIFGGIFFFMFLLDQIFVKHAGLKLRGADIPDTVTYEEESPLGFKLPKFAKFLMVIASLLIAGYLFTSIVGQPTLSIVGAPTFGAIDIGPTGNALLSGVAGVMEDYVFFGLIGPTLASFVFALTRKYWIGLLAALGVTPLIFMVYHIGRYGDSFTALDQVLQFGFLMMLLTIVLGNLLIVHAIHFGNNSGITYALSHGADLSGMFIVYVGLIGFMLVGYALVKWKRRHR